MSKKLVAYFSASGVTAHAAKELARITGADIYEIQPKIPYTNADLNWMNPFSRSTKEMKGKIPYPAIKDENVNIRQYDEILLAFPIWWYKAPVIINTFLEKYDFSGKTIVLFATSGGSDLGKSAEELKKSVSDTAIIKDGIMLNGAISENSLAGIK